MKLLSSQMTEEDVTSLETTFLCSSAVCEQSMTCRLALPEDPLTI